jgi:hypothetical protein
VSLVAVVLISVCKRLVPIPWRAHGTMDFLCVRFLRRFVSPDAVELLIRHFVIETNLLNAIVRNTSADGVAPVTLLPTTLAELGNRAVLIHDINVYDVFCALGDRRVERPDRLDWSGLEMPAIDPERGRRRFMRLDIQTALCLMNIPFALCLTPAEYRRAVHSMRFDDSILAVLADLTGDETFMRWRTGLLSVRLDSSVDVPATVYRHAVVCEYAHAHLRRLAESDHARS